MRGALDEKQYFPQRNKRPVLSDSSALKGASKTTLIEASREGKVEVVEALLAAGADREAKDKVVPP